MNEHLSKKFDKGGCIDYREVGAVDAARIAKSSGNGCGIVKRDYSVSPAEHLAFEKRRKEAIKQAEEDCEIMIAAAADRLKLAAREAVLHNRSRILKDALKEIPAWMKVFEAYRFPKGRYEARCAECSARISRNKIMCLKHWGRAASAYAERLINASS